MGYNEYSRRCLYTKKIKVLIIDKVKIFISSFLNVFIVKDITLDVLVIQYVAYVMRLFIPMKQINNKKPMLTKMFVRKTTST